MIRTSALVANLKVVGGRDRVVVKSAQVRLDTDPSQGPCPERCRMDQDANFFKEEMDAR